jgi:polyisoprenyl-phosphate glycosyltransferase
MKNTPQKPILSLIVPCHNEEENIPDLYFKFKEVWQALQNQYEYELIFIDDGSSDGSVEAIEKLHKTDPMVKLVELSRNFGKEVALSAGVHECNGDACIFLDADLQYPIDILPQFLTKWSEGYEVVVGIRDKKNTNNLIETVGSKMFYLIINNLSEIKIQSGALDYRLLDRKVIEVYKQFSERNRMTRALIDWLGFKRTTISYTELARTKGTPSYSFIKRFKLALWTMVTQSLFPLRFAGYLGIYVTLFSGLLGVYLLLDSYVFDDQLPGAFSGPFMIGVLTVFLNGLTLSCLGLIALYIENIHIEVMDRPLYVIRKKI